ncbi:MAG: aminopeptidase P family protein [Chloroflexi bacterium]|nr:aminopeptidase P family protein [Chloroflexota bacterium]
MYKIQHEKLAQAISILNENDVWITFVRETAHNSDPVLELILGFGVTWHSALIISGSGRKIAIVGRYEVESVRRMGGYDEVIGYDASIQPTLRAAIDELRPAQVLVNYSESDSAADGLSHGMCLTLARYLEGYPLASAESVISALRGRKSPSEISRIRAAVDLTAQVIDSVTGLLRPGLSEVDIARHIHAEFDRHGVTPAWEPAHCPAVNCGPESPLGHTGPSADYIIQPGQLVHIDLGVKLDDYVSDIQRVWYLQPAGEQDVPRAIQDAFRAVHGAIQAAADVLRPGVQGWQVDQAAREHLVSTGYPEYQHATGHHIGRTVHDGATALGPRWERYGQTPFGIVEAGNVFTLELGVSVPGYGAVSLEEDVLVTDSGIEWLMEPQTEPIVVPV